jgi:O-antigen biosynthesis protein
MPLDLHGDFRQTSERGFEGYALDRSDLTRILVIEIVIDGEVVKTMVANAWVPGLAAGEAGDGCYGFAWLIPESWSFSMNLIEARVANLGLRIGEALPVIAIRHRAANVLGSGMVRWQGDDRLTGSCASIMNFPISLQTPAGDMLAQARHPSGWSLPGPGTQNLPQTAFDLRLPPELADGRVHRLRVIDASGEELNGSPLTVQVPSSARDGLPRMMHEQLGPRSMPFARYREQQLALRLSDGGGRPLPRVGVVFVGDEGLDLSIAALQKIEGPDWVAAVLDETGGPGTFAPDMLAETLAGELAACDFVIVTIAGMELSAGGLADLLRKIEGAPQDHVFTADWAWKDARPDQQLVLLPSFDLERFLEQGYCGFLFGMARPELMARAEAGASSIFELVCADLDHIEGLHHVEGVLGHLARAALGTYAPTLASASANLLVQSGEQAAIAVDADLSLPALHINRDERAGRVSIILPEPASEDALQRTLKSLKSACATRETDITMVVAAGSALAGAGAILQAGNNHIRVVTAGSALNRAAQMNAGAKAATGDFLCFIDPDCTAPDDGWLGELTGRLAAKQTGVAGGLLVHPSGLILDGGRVLGPEFSAVPAFANRLATDTGFNGLLTVAHQVSALGEGCLLIRRGLFETAGGYDQNSFARHFTKADLCLRLRERGFATVCTPHVHFARDTAPGTDDARWSPVTARHYIELRTFRNRWSDWLQHDPAYNALLNRDQLPYTGLSFPPAADRQDLTKSRAIQFQPHRNSAPGSTG